ncbi:MAG: aspartate--tRNA(Asn) ligase [Candidatus Saccharimonadales bacterium]
MRVISNQLSEKIGEQVHLEGWLHKKRLLGGLTFVNLRDRGGVVQAVLKDKKEVDKLKGLYTGTVLSLDGTVVKEDRAPGGVELHDTKLEVLVPVSEEPPIEIDKPLSHKPENLDTLFEYRSIGLRNLSEAKVFIIRSSLLKLIREFLYSRDFIEIQTPKLVANAAEGGAEVFKLDYFGKQASLAQSPQLYKQVMVGVYERVFEIGPAFRAEPSATTRHVSEVTMLDIEMAFIQGHDDVLDMLQDLLNYVLDKVWQEQGPNLEELKAVRPVLKPKFPRYSMRQIHELYGSANHQDMSAEVDLTPDEERWICEYAKEHDGCEAVFATDLPKSKMKFYHMAKDDNSAYSADLLFRGLELATIPVREHRYDNLVKQMQAAGIKEDDPAYKFYLQAFKHGLPMHGGCGFGIDRLVEKVIGLGNIKEAILFPRDINRLTP